jgi:hypothetical protein
MRTPSVNSENWCCSFKGEEALLYPTLSTLKTYTLSECDALRAQTQTAQTESATAASQTAAMASLNLKLQSSASKIQAKNIELELKKLEARENRLLLGIVQVFLPSRL